VPRGFSEQERLEIRQRLLERGRELLATYGVRKTNVEDLTKAVGISKGAFYLFFRSKEELFFEVLQEVEQRFREEIKSRLKQPGKQPRERFSEAILEVLLRVRAEPITRSLDQDELAYLMRRLPQKMLQEHVGSDERFAGEIISALEAEGLEVREDRRVFTGLLRALFYLSLHQEQFEAELYPEVLGVLTRLVMSHLISERRPD
jgi:AcrR family transcriptional regulator